MAFVDSDLFVVTDTGGLFRVANSAGGRFSTLGTSFGGFSSNVADYIDGSRELLAAANLVTTFMFDPVTGSSPPSRVPNQFGSRA